MNVEWGNSLWHLVADSDAMTFVILFILLCMSIMCWSIFLYKMVLLNVRKRHMTSALRHIKNCETFDDLKNKVGAIAHTTAGYFLVRNFSCLKAILESLGSQAQLREIECALLDAHVDQMVDELVLKDEQYLPFLSTSAAIAPLLGLFGTVWGLIYAFIRISERGSADIVSIAPGIAAALITTLAGLLVAIPALVMYHYLVLQVRDVEQHLIRIADKFRFLVQMAFIIKM
jgi:biopolymer transport protein TolQ